MSPQRSRAARGFFLRHRFRHRADERRCHIRPSDHRRSLNLSQDGLEPSAEPPIARRSPSARASVGALGRMPDARLEFPARDAECPKVGGQADERGAVGWVEDGGCSGRKTFEHRLQRAEESAKAKQANEIVPTGEKGAGPKHLRKLKGNCLFGRFRSGVAGTGSVTMGCDRCSSHGASGVDAGRLIEAENNCNRRPNLPESTPRRMNIDRGRGTSHLGQGNTRGRLHSAGKVSA